MTLLKGFEKFESSIAGQRYGKKLLRQMLRHICMLTGIRRVGRQKLQCREKVIVGVSAKLEGWPWTGVGRVHS